MSKDDIDKILRGIIDAPQLLPPPQRGLVPVAKLVLHRAANARILLSKWGARDMLTFAEPIEETTENVLRPDWKPVAKSVDTPIDKPLETNDVPINATHEKPRWDYPLVAIAAGVFCVAMWINVQNAGGFKAIFASPMVALGLFMESLLFFMLPRTLTLRGLRLMLALVLCVFLFSYALTNSLRIASVTTADTTQERVTQIASQQNSACGSATTTTTKRGDKTTITKTGESAGCAVVKAQPGQATPESKDFAKLIGWLSFGYLKVTEDAFGMLWLLLRTIAPQLGGLVLLLARPVR
jgi:hypothetical protein